LQSVVSFIFSLIEASAWSDLDAIPSPKGGEDPPSYHNVTPHNNFVSSGSQPQGIIMGTGHQILGSGSSSHSSWKKDNEDNKGKNLGHEPSSGSQVMSWKSGQCIPKTKDLPRYKIQSNNINNRIQYMKDHAIISKFISIWPNENDLIRWIKQWWKLKGQVDLRLDSKGFFTTIFHSLEDRDGVFKSRALLLWFSWIAYAILDREVQP
jgi:hypothetical protein